MSIESQWVTPAADLVAGVDEVGRGPLAGPVVAAAVILNSARPVEGLADSKKLSPARRRVLAGQIRRQALAWSVAAATVEEVDRLNVLQASLLAMARAVAKLRLVPQRVLVDGNQIPKFADREYSVEAVIRGDQTVPSISAASIVAKVCRDRLMDRLDRRYPGYGFVSNSGYPTRTHLNGLEQLGPSPVHRRSFAPVARVLERGR